MFNVFKKCLNSKATFTSEDVAKVNDFVFCRWLSGSYSSLPLAQMFNQYPNIPMLVKLQMVQKVLGNKVRYIPYPKAEKHDDTQIVRIAKYYNIGKNEAQQCLEFISAKELNDIDDYFKSMEQ